jgi:hypothetical protein
VLGTSGEGNRKFVVGCNGFEIKLLSRAAQSSKEIKEESRKGNDNKQ